MLRRKPEHLGSNPPRSACALGLRGPSVRRQGVVFQARCSSSVRRLVPRKIMARLGDESNESHMQNIRYELDQSERRHPFMGIIQSNPRPMLQDSGMGEGQEFLAQKQK